MSNPIVTITGRLANDPEFKSLSTGSLLKFRVITSDRMKTQDGEWVDKDTSGWDVEAWSKLADTANGQLKKGMSVVLVGTMKVRSYEKDGAKRYVTELRATDIAVNVFSLDKVTPKFDSSSTSEPWSENLVRTPF